ncbi:hypothetical protein R1sor_020185 [Riccia sorocarpa]|uniref:Uncharacterized protein n=1 Tax=Riccia sorocarpa TaxID=122646 RepID=A0ABD3IEL0_9MARC
MDLGYDDGLPTPISLAIQTTMASIRSESVHRLIQDLDREAIEANRQSVADADGVDIDAHAVLLLESLGIENWIQIRHTAKVKGDEAALNLVRKLQEDLPSVLKTDQLDETRALKHATMIGRALIWVDLEKNVYLKPEEKEDQVDVSAQIRNNPLIDFDVFSSEEQAGYTENLDNLSNSLAGETVAMSDKGDPFVPTDSARTIEYNVSEKGSMMWKLSNMNSLAPLSAAIWGQLINISEVEEKQCLDAAINGIAPAKVLPWREAFKMSFFRDKYSCQEPVAVRVKVTVFSPIQELEKYTIVDVIQVD